MALEGTLRDFSLADILQLIGIQKKTGILTLEREDEVIKIVFLDGQVVGAEQAQEKLEHRLGSVLVKTGIITKSDLAKALKIQKETLKRLGSILVEEGFIEKGDLSEALENQILQVVYGIFRWKDGNYHFRPEKFVDYDKENITPISTESVLMEGLRMLDEWPLIEAKLNDPEMVLTRTEKAEQIRSKLKSTDNSDIFETDGLQTIPYEQDYILQLIDGISSISDIASRSKFIEFDTYRIIYDLMENGLVTQTNLRPVDTSDYSEFILDRKEDKSVLLVVFAGVMLLLATLISFYSPINNLLPSLFSFSKGVDSRIIKDCDKLSDTKALELRQMILTNYVHSPSGYFQTEEGYYLLKGKSGLKMPFSYSLVESTNEDFLQNTASE